MSYRERVDKHSELFMNTWTRPKRQKSQINGQTQLSQTNIILQSNAKSPPLVISKKAELVNFFL
ncbi:hypothetical protein GCM10020331_089240 [Ectobacillus funiculus]